MGASLWRARIDVRRARVMFAGWIARQAVSASPAVAKRRSRLRSSARSRNRSIPLGHFSPVASASDGAARSSLSETRTAAVVPSNGSRPESDLNATAPTA